MSPSRRTANVSFWRKPEGSFCMSDVVIVNDKMQRGYSYERTAPVGAAFAPAFTPDLTPPEMLGLGGFGGNDIPHCQGKFPAAWVTHAKLSPGGKDPRLNYFGVDASQPLSVWR